MDTSSSDENALEDISEQQNSNSDDEFKFASYDQEGNSLHFYVFFFFNFIDH